MRKSFLFAGFLSFFVTVIGFGRDPQGENAKYQLDRNRHRTSSLILRGKLELKVGVLDSSVGAKGAYKSQFSYDLTVLMGHKVHGVKNINIPSEFFAPEFMIHLREVKDLDLKSFKIRHLGFADAHTRFGQVYPACDKVLLYDLKGLDTQDFKERLEQTIGDVYEVQGEMGSAAFDLEDATILAHVSSSLPALGAALIDASGIVSGAKMKVGFDYLPPASQDPDGRPAPDSLTVK